MTLNPAAVEDRRRSVGRLAEARRDADAPSDEARATIGRVVGRTGVFQLEGRGSDELRAMARLMALLRADPAGTSVYERPER